MADKGFHGVTIVDLGAALGMTGPALYRHFATKQGVLDAMLLDVSERLVAGGQDRATDLGELVRFHIDFALREPDLIRVQDRDLSSLSEEARRTVGRLQRSYVEIWVEQLRVGDPDVPVEEARATVLAVIGLINSTPYSRTGLSRDRRASLLESLSLAALAATFPGCVAA
jgi:AcrR family transcriptional regulator